MHCEGRKEVSLAEASGEARGLLPHRSEGDPEEAGGAGDEAKVPADSGSAAASAEGRTLKGRGLTVHDEQGMGRVAAGLA